MTNTMYRFQAGQFLIIATIEPDQDPDLSFDDTGETAEKLESGEWEAFQTKVAVIDAHGVEIGTDYLGGSIYSNPKDFFTEHYGLAAKGRKDGCTYGAYFPDMVREAVGEARTYLKATQAVKVRANA